MCCTKCKMRTIKIAAAQTPEFRDTLIVALNYASNIITQAEAHGASLIVFPECFLQGYFTDEETARRVAYKIKSHAFEALLKLLPENGPMIVMGMIELDNGQLFNTAIVLKDRIVIGSYRKENLLNGERIFTAGTDSSPFEIDGLRFGINICYDTNFPETSVKSANVGATLLVCLSNNMMRRDKAEQFKEVHNLVRGERCRETGLWLISSDVTGERDDKVGLGPTAILNTDGRVIEQLPLCRPGLLVFDLPYAD